MATYGAERIPWNFQVPTWARDKVRQLAALNGIAISEAMERLVFIALKSGYDFVPLPRGVKVIYRHEKGERIKQSNYTIPIPMAEYLESVVNVGYRRDYVATALIARGLEIVKSRESAGHGEDLDSGKVVKSAQRPRADERAISYPRVMGEVPEGSPGSVEAMRRLRIGLLRQVSDSGEGDVPIETGGTFDELT